ncbi:hypothetical protein BsWGS_28772 [Bradybaena similaris]
MDDDDFQPKPRDNRGHSLEVVPDLSPYEVDKLTRSAKRPCDSFDIRRKQGLTSLCDEFISGPCKIHTPTKPSVLYYDGRAYNQLGEYLFQSDPCKYLSNISQFVPERPRTFVPAAGHYSGLGKPPVRQYFKLIPMRVHENRVMPAYEIFDSRDLCHYYKNSV